jgi:hypothetical protein
MSRLVLLLTAVVFCAPGCDAGSEGSEDFVYHNAILRGVNPLQAAASGTLERPDFSWPATDEKHVACAVFERRISVRKNQITNADDIIWVWHSGLGTGRDGNVLYEHGVANEAGQDPPDRLPTGTYYWAVWALDEQGLPISATDEYTLTVPR